MDKIKLSAKDAEAVLTWRDQNPDLVRLHKSPFKAILLDFPETKIQVKAITNTESTTFYIAIRGQNVGKIVCRRLAFGLYQTAKNTTDLHPDDIQSIITVYASTMALIVHHTSTQEETPTIRETPQKEKPHHHKKTAAPRKKSSITYLLRNNRGALSLQPSGSRAKPKHAFGVRGHDRHYKSGKVVWIREHIRGGDRKKKNKTYKIAPETTMEGGSDGA